MKNRMEIESLIDTVLLQSLQNMFCKGFGIYMICVDSSYELLTRFTGTKKEWAWLRKHIPAESYYALIERARENRTQQILKEKIGKEGLFLYSVGINISGKDQITWIVAALIREQFSGEGVPEYLQTTDGCQITRSLELIAYMSRLFFAVKMEELIAQEAMEASQISESRMERQFHRSEAMTEIVRMLESENGFASIVEDIIREACMCLRLPGGALLQEQEGQMVEAVCAYCLPAEKDWTGAARRMPKERLPFFDGKTYIFSCDTERSPEFADFFEKKGLGTGIFLPIIKEDEPVMYLCFSDRNPERKWSVTEIKFLSDVRHIVQEIYTKREAKNSLATSYDALKAILENTGCGIYVMEPLSGKLLFANERFRDLFWRTAEKGDLEKMISEGREVSNSFDEVYVPADERWVDLNRTRIHWVDGREVCLCTIYDVTEKKRYQEKIESQANNDFLTGLFNRMRCEQDLEKYIHEAVHHGREGALLYLDLDDFKNINDALGHEYGDILLKEISDCIRNIRGVENRCYRMGGDEFIVIVTDRYYSQLGLIIEEIRSAFLRPWMLKGGDYYCTMCMGVVCFPSDADNVGDVIRKADLALFGAKRKGNNHVEFYNASEAGSPYRRLDLENNIRKATMNAISEFEVYYQPIMDIRGEKDVCCGAEALARWNSAELGFISPGDFIPIAEHLGLINPIGEHILKKAARQCRYWNDMGHPDYHVNVNLSVIQLLQKDIVDKVREAIEETGIRPANLRLEVTESLAINDIARMVSVLAEIKSLGVGVALDDFGTGYSSLNHIRALPIDIIKIDRCFIEHIAEDDFSAAFVNMVVQLADAIDVAVCVEGVELTSQYEKVKAAKVDMIQGYYFGKPMPLSDFEEKYL